MHLQPARATPPTCVGGLASACSAAAAASSACMASAICRSPGSLPPAAAAAAAFCWLSAAATAPAGAPSRSPSCSSSRGRLRLVGCSGGRGGSWASGDCSCCVGGSAPRGAFPLSPGARAAAAASGAWSPPLAPAAAGPPPPLPLAPAAPAAPSTSANILRRLVACCRMSALPAASWLAAMRRSSGRRLSSAGTGPVQQGQRIELQMQNTGQASMACCRSATPACLGGCPRRPAPPPR